MTNNSQKIQYKRCDYSQVTTAKNAQNTVMLCQKFIKSLILMSFIETVSLTRIILHQTQWKDCHQQWVGSQGLFYSSFTHSRIKFVGCDTMNFNRQVPTFGGNPVHPSSGLLYPNDEGSTFLQNVKFSVYSFRDQKQLFYGYIQLTAVNVLHN